MKKRFFATLLSLLLCAAPALAQQQDVILSATVEPVQTVALNAPATGELAPFTVRAGDVVAQGETLFTVEPVSVYAPVDGTVSAVFVQPGDIASAAVSRYGAAMYITYEEPYLLSASVRTGVDKPENRDLRVGQQVYLRSNNEENFADGFISAYDSATGNVTVQVIGGDLVYNHTVKIYRTPDYDYNALIGRGTLLTAAPCAVSAGGTITQVGVSAGDEVKAGDYLFSYVPDELDPDRRGRTDATQAKAEDDWLITAVSAQPGATVQKGQCLLTAVRMGDWELTAQVEEAEVGRIAVGDVFSVRFEEAGLPEAQATVSFVSPLGASSGDVSLYTVRLSFDAPDGVWPGMHATIQK